MSVQGPRPFINKWSRKVHRWAALIAALPILIVIGTGILLLLKKDVGWIQPPTMRGEKGPPLLTLEQVLEAAKSAPEAGIGGWEDVDRIDYRPGHGAAKVQGRNRWEVQVCLRTGAVLHTAVRRSDLIEAIHDGSWFHERVKYWVFLPSAVFLLGLWLTGIYLFVLPYWARAARERRRRRASQ